jgi:hypothetical protein
VFKAAPSRVWFAREFFRISCRECSSILRGSNEAIDAKIGDFISTSAAAAIQRMIPAHAQEITGYEGWAVRTERLPNGVRLTVTATDPNEVARIRGLGFIGILASGLHHQPHHLAMAKGEFAHVH